MRSVRFRLSSLLLCSVMLFFRCSCCIRVWFMSSVSGSR